MGKKVDCKSTGKKEEEQVDIAMTGVKNIYLSILNF
jgi:hypothetical protein